MRRNRASLVSDTPRNKESIWEVKTSTVDKLSEPAEVIFLGDSTVRSAVHDETISKALGKNAVNLGLTGDLGTYGDYRMLEYYLAKNKAPKYVVVWHTMDVWPRRLQDFIFNYTNPSLSELKDHFTNNFAKNPFKFAPVVIEHFMVNTFYLYRYKTFFRDHYNSLFHHSEETQFNPIVIAWNETKTTPSKDNLFWLKKLSELCRRNGIILIAGESPLLNQYYELLAMKEYLRKQQRELISIYGNLGIKFVPGHYVFVPEETVNFNMDHVNEKGAVNASKFYGIKLKSELNP